jgi:hypothetical protein
MSATQIRETLHEYIDTADEKKLEAIYTVLKDSIEPDYQYQANELEAVYMRREIYKKGESEVMTTEEFVRYVRQNNL